MRRESERESHVPPERIEDDNAYCRTYPHGKLERAVSAAKMLLKKIADLGSSG